MRNRVLSGGLVAVLVGSCAYGQGQGTFPVILVFENNVRFQDFERSFSPDDRSAADPTAWGYLNRGVAGAVQYLERRGGFRANDVFSHTIRGFSARLTTNQIQRLENDSLVRFVEPD